MSKKSIVLFVVFSVISFLYLTPALEARHCSRSHVSIQFGGFVAPQPCYTTTYVMQPCCPPPAVIYETRPVYVYPQPCYQEVRVYRPAPCYYGW